ncbi:MAG: glycine betaine ABC transporter substrate-binding protein [Pseudonocardiaceae bacterium]
MLLRSTRRRPRRLTAAVALGAAAMLTLAGCGGLSQGSGPNAAPGSLAKQVNLTGASYTVGGKDFDEQLVLCEMAVAALESVGAKVTDRCNVGGTQATRNALLGGQIDMYWGYTGTAWVTFFNQKPIQNSEQQYQAVRDRDLKQNQIVWLTPTKFNNTYAFAVHEPEAQKMGLKTLSDMADFYRSGKRGKTCVESEYLNRDDGLPGLQRTYGFQIPPDELQVRQTGAIYQATANPNDCLFGEVFTTDGRIPALNLRVLKDDKVYHPLYNAAISIRKQAYDQNPAIAKVFAPIANALTDEVMLKLNARKSADNVNQRTVARDWLQQEGFIGKSG